MGNMCSRGGAGGPSVPHSNMLSNPQAYFDALYGSSEGPNPSPYHPLASKPVRVPTLFELALEQLCVSLVDQQSLEGVLAQQQRKRRSSLQPYSDGSQEIDEAEGRSGAQTPTTPLAAAVWATTPLQRGAAGATRRYSHADALQHSHQAQQQNHHHSASPGKGKHGLKSTIGAPHSPFSPHSHPFLLPPTSPSAMSIPHFAASTSGVMLVTGGAAMTPPKPVKRARSMSLSSKESPELAPQGFVPGSVASAHANASQRMLLAATISPSNTSNGSSGNSSMAGHSYSSVGSSPLQQSFASSMASAAGAGAGTARSVPASPFMLGASSSTSSPNNHNSSSSSASAQYQYPPAGFPPLHRAFSDPYTLHNQHAAGSSCSVPAPPQKSWMEPPELHLGPTSSSSLTLGGGGAAASGGAHFVSAADAAEDVMDGRRLSTSTLLSAGSMTLGVGSSVAFVGGQPSLLHQRQLRLPDSIVQLIFDRLISEELLTVHNIHLFTSACLSQIDFSGLPPGHRESTDINVANQCGKYGHEITDEWMAVLFESTVKHYARMQANWNAAQEERARAKAKLFAQSIPRATSTPASPMITGAAVVSSSSSKHVSPEAGASASASSSLLPRSRSTSSATPIPVGSTPSPSIFQQLRQGESKESVASAAAASTALQPFECPPALSVSATSSPKLLAQTSTPHHGSISHLNLERQLSAAKLNLGDPAGSLPNSPPREIAGSVSSFSTPSPLGLNKPRSVSSASGTSPPPASLSLLQALSHTHSAASLAASSSCSSPHSMPTVHNPLSVTSPSPSLALYQSAPSLTSLNLSGCSLLTNRALMPLQLCLMLKVLNLNSCTQISDELLSCTLANKYFLEELQLKGLRSITNETLKVLTDKTRLRKLHLDCCSLSDEGLTTLGALTNLESFSVGWCGKRVSERGLSWLAGCFRLQVVCIAFTAVGSLAFLASLRLLRELNIAGLKISDPVGLKNPALFPCLKSAFMQRTHLREIPPSVLHYHLQVLDLSFSSDVPPARLLHQFTLWNACKQPQLPVVASNGAASSVASGAAGEADYTNLFGSSFGSAASSSSSTPPRDYDPQRLGSLLSSTLRGEAADFSSSSTSPESSPPFNSTIQSSSAGGSSLSTSPPALHATLAPGANPHSIQLRRLVLESCCVTNRIAGCIAEMTNLIELNVSDTDMTGDGLIALAPLVKLRILNVSGCKISNASVATIATHMTVLRELYMDCPSVTDQGLAHLKGSPLLARNLERLDIFETHITDTGLDALQDFRRLRFLEACGGRITNAGLAKLALRHPQLTSLNLSQNKGIDDLGIDVLRHLTKLVHVNLSGTGVTHRGLAFLQEIKPGGKSGSGGSSGGASGSSNHHDSTGRGGSVGAGAGIESSLRNISLFGCEIKVTSAKLAALPAGVQLGIDEGIVSIE